MAFFNQLFTSSDLNAPPLFGAAGSLLNVLNACLVDGFGYTGIAITSITRSGTTATVTVSATDGLRIATGSYVTVTGCTGGDASIYNIGALWTRATATTYTYTMGSTPSGSATGTPVASLALPVTSITESGTNYTVVLGAVNATLNVGDYITFTGGSPGGVNIAMKINTVTDSTHVICTGPGSLGTITGTITYAKSHLQWTRPFAAGTNAQTYRSADTASNQFYLQIVDNAGVAALQANVYGAEVMSADQTVTTNQFPTTAQYASGMPLRKSATSDSTTARAWRLYGDGKTFYLYMLDGDSFAATTYYVPLGFGHIISDKPSDGYNTFIAAHATSNNANIGDAGLAMTTILGYANNTAAGGMYLARTYTQSGTAVFAWMASTNSSAGNTQIVSTGTTRIAYPRPEDQGLMAMELFITDASTRSRGRMPGLYVPFAANPWTTGDVSANVTNFPGMTLMAQSVGTGNSSIGQLLIDRYGPWV